MTDPNAIRAPANTPSAAERMGLLHTLAFTALRLSSAQLDAFTSRLAVELSTLAAKTDGSDDADLYRHAFQHLSQHRITFQRLVNDCLQASLLQAAQAAAEQGTSRLESGAMDLSLTTFDAMEHKVTIDNLSQALELINADALAALGLRIAHWLQPEESSPARNPFRPEVFLKAVSDAWGKFDLNGASHRLVLRQMRPDIFLQLDPVLQALNQELAARNVLPDAEHAARHKKADAIPPPSIRDKLRNWLAPEGTLNIADARAAELLEKMFAHMLRDALIPADIRNVLGRLRTPLFKAALLDKEFFFNEKHPARRLLETIVRSGLGCRPEAGDADPLRQTIVRIAGCVQNEDAQADLFENAASELDAFIAQEDQKLAGKLNESIAEAIKQENHARAQRMADDDVVSRIETGEVDGFIEVFLQSQWNRVLAFAYGVRDVKPEVLSNVLKAMDDLIWSVKPKTGADERRELVERLPALLAMLNAWLNVVKWDGAEREAFFATLAGRHAAAMRMPAELSPRDRLEIRMNMVQKASEHHLGKRAQEQQEAAIAEFMQLVDRLAPGSWLEFVRNDGSKLNCRLVWISPCGSRFVFVGRQGQLLFTLSDEALAQALRAARASIIPTGTAVERALAAALQDLG